MTAELMAGARRRLALVSAQGPSWLVPLMSLVATVLSWRPVAWAKVAPDLDASWQSGLAEAFEHGLQWGPGVIFSFGPYGFVDTLEPFYRNTALVAVLFALGVSWGIAALVVSALRPSWGLLPASAIAWAVLGVANGRTGYADLASVLALGLALGAFWSCSGARRLALLGLLGAVAGFLLLTKFNDGLVSLGLVVVVVTGQFFIGGLRAFGRGLAAGAVAMVAAFLSAWTGAAQSLSHLQSYLRGSLAVALGYSSAMGLSRGRWEEDIFAAAALGLLAAVFYLAACRLPVALGAKVCLGVALVGWSWATFKEGFVRHDLHDLTFFGLVAVALALARLRRRAMVLQGGALAATTCFFCLAAGAVPPQLHSPAASASALLADLRAVTGLGSFSSANRQLRADLVAAGNSLPPRALALAEGHSVAIEPALEAAAFVYRRLRWDPEPVLQGYSAYTSYLDHLDASFLSSARAPQLIVYQPSQVIDGRDPWMDPPATLEAMYCHYRQVAVAGGWQVLSRLREPGRCLKPRFVERARAHFGQPVEVPQARGAMVVATFSLNLPVTYKLEDVLLRPPIMRVALWPADGGGPVSYRFVPGTAGDLHVLVAPPELGYSASFTPPAARRVALVGGGWPTGRGHVTVSFYAIKLRGPLPAATSG